MGGGTPAGHRPKEPRRAQPALQGRVCGGWEGVLTPDVGRQMGATSGTNSSAMLWGEEAHQLVTARESHVEHGPGVGAQQPVDG